MSNRRNITCKVIEHVNIVCKVPGRDMTSLTLKCGIGPVDSSTDTKTYTTGSGIVNGYTLDAAGNLVADTESSVTTVPKADIASLGIGTFEYYVCTTSSGAEAVFLDGLLVIGGV